MKRDNFPTTRFNLKTYLHKYVFMLRWKYYERC